MKRYKLLKDLPFAKAGDEFGLYHGDDRSMILAPKEWDKHLYEIDISDIENFDEWFEEIKEIEVPDEFYVPSVYADKRKIEAIRANDKISSSFYLQTLFLNYSEIGLAFKTKEETERCIEYLKAKVIIKQDAKGFKPDWKNPSQKRFFGYYNLIDKKLCYFNADENMESKIYFGSKEDIKESFKKHPKEWKTYLAYEQ